MEELFPVNYGDIKDVNIHTELEKLLSDPVFQELPQSTNSLETSQTLVNKCGNFDDNLYDLLCNEPKQLNEEPELLNKKTTKKSNKEIFSVQCPLCSKVFRLTKSVLALKGSIARHLTCKHDVCGKQLSMAVAQFNAQVGHKPKCVESVQECIKKQEPWLKQINIDQLTKESARQILSFSELENSVLCFLCNKKIKSDVKNKHKFREAWIYHIYQYRMGHYILEENDGVSVLIDKGIEYAKKLTQLFDLMHERKKSGERKKGGQKRKRSEKSCVK